MDPTANTPTPPRPGVADQARALWQKMTPRRRFLVVGAVALTLLGVGAVRMMGSGESYAVLFSGLAPEDAGQVTAELAAQKIPYRVGAGGSSIEVPEARVHEVRISLASAGLPRGGGVGFEIFDGQTFGTNSFVEQVNYRRALQGELARSIGSLDAVDSARVHIAMGKRSIFREADEPPSASVALKLYRGRTLSAAQVRGIVHLVASSVDGLAADSVVVIDERGNVLSSGEQEGIGAESHQDFERELSQRVRTMIEKVVGSGHAAVSVTAEMDYSRINTTEEMYDKNNTAIRSEVKMVEGSGAVASEVGGVAGARGNLPGAPAPTTTAGGEGAQRLSQTTNYEVPRVVKQTVGPAVKIKRLHVAVLVDHKTVPDPRSKTKGATVQVPRSDDELAHIAAIVREAAGVDSERGDRLEVRNVPFEEPAPVEVEPAPAPAMPWPLPVPPEIAIPAAGGALLLIVGAIVLVMMKRRRRREPVRGVRAEVLPLPAAIHEVEKALEMQGAGALGAGATPRQLSASSGDIHQRILVAVKGDTARAARVISALLAEPKGGKA